MWIVSELISLVVQLFQIDWLFGVKWTNQKGKILARKAVKISRMNSIVKQIFASTLIEMTILDIDFSKGLAGFLIALWVGNSVPETLAPGVTVAENDRQQFSKFR